MELTVGFAGKAISGIRHKLKDKGVNGSGEPLQWREKAIIELSLAGMLLGFLLLIAAAIWDMHYHHTWVAIFNTCIYLTLVYVAFSKETALQLIGIFSFFFQ